jgi:hypothetical protein
LGSLVKIVAVDVDPENLAEQILDVLSAVVQDRCRLPPSPEEI